LKLQDVEKHGKRPATCKFDMNSELGNGVNKMKGQRLHQKVNEHFAVSKAPSLKQKMNCMFML
jgi:hypothetical protein